MPPPPPFPPPMCGRALLQIRSQIVHAWHYARRTARDAGFWP